MTTRHSLVFLAALLIADMPVIAQQKQDTAVEKVASAIEQALKSFTGEEKAKPAAPARPAMPAPAFGGGLGGFGAVPAVAVQEKDVEKRLHRLQSHAAVLQDWINFEAKLTEPQQQRLTTTLKTSISELQKSWRAAGAQNNQRTFDDFFPICFTDLTGPARHLDAATTEAIAGNEALSGEQSSQLLKSLDAREEFYRTAALGYVLNLLDEHFFLTPVQRAKVGDVVSKKIDLEATCYSMQTQEQRSFQYFTSTSVIGMVFPWKPKGVFSDSQRVLVTKLTEPHSAAAGNNEYIQISTGDDAETLDQRLKEISATQRTRLHQNLAVRIDFHHATADLTERDVRRLQLAGKGAMDKVIRAWKISVKSSHERYKSNERFAGRNITFSMSAPKIDQLVNNELWTHTVKSVVPEDSKAITNRDQSLKEARAKFVVAMLDRELWLEPFQRERLLKSVEKILPSGDVTRSNHQQNIDEISLLCLPLFKLSKLDLTILSPAQRTVWKAMKEPFTENNGYLQVQTKRNGTLTIRLPQ